MPSEDAKFDEQAFLLDFFQQTVVANQNVTYPKFVQLEGDPTGIMNKLLATGGQEILDLRTEQFPLMVPQVRIYKIYHPMGGGKTTEEELIFDDYTSIESITKDMQGRGSDVGLKSFTWEDQGTTPGDTGLSFKASLKLHFQSFEGVFKIRKQTKDTTLRFADLLVPGGGKKPKPPPGARKEYDDSFYQVKTIVGWAIPNDPKRVVFPDPSILDKCRVSFILTLVSHEIDVKEDGSLDVTIDYIAALEGRMLSPKADLLYVENQENVKQLQDARRKLRAAKGDIHKAQAADERRAKQKKHLGGHRKPPPNEGLLDKAGRKWANLVDVGATKDYDAGDGVKIGGSNKEVVEAEVAKHVAEVDKLTRVARLESYGRLLKKLEDPSRRRILYFTLTQVQINAYLAANEETFEEEKNPRVRRERQQNYRMQELRKIPTMGGGDFSLSHTSKNESHNILTQLNAKLIAAGADEKKKTAALEEAKKQFNDKNKSIKSTYDVNFFFLGDLIQSALDIIYENTGEHSTVDPQDQFGFMLGTIDLVDPISKKLEAVPLSDIPISLNTFNIWFQKNIIEPQLNRMPFQTFVRKICSELIVGALNPSNYGAAGKSTNTRTSMSNFVLTKNAIPQGGRQRIWDLKNTLRQQTNAKGAKDLKQYLFLYVGGAIGNTLKGKAKEDKELGIFHLYSGADHGAVKKVSFKRTDLPGQKEVRISKGKELAVGNLMFSDVYSCDITMIGNPVFKPGMLVFVDPTSMGLGLASQRRSWASQMGIGGYYLVTKVESIIEDGKFETNLSTEAQAPIGHLNKIEGSQRIVHNSTNPKSTTKLIGEPKDAPRRGHESEAYKAEQRAARAAQGRRAGY